MIAFGGQKKKEGIPSHWHNFKLRHPIRKSQWESLRLWLSHSKCTGGFRNESSNEVDKTSDTLVRKGLLGTTHPTR